MFVLSFNFVGLTVQENHLTKLFIFGNWREQKNEEIKERINSKN